MMNRNVVAFWLQVSNFLQEKYEAFVEEINRARESRVQKNDVGNHPSLIEV